MKIGTISLNINTPDFNYGAILHSWAFLQYLKKLDFVEYAEIIDYTMPRMENQDLKKPVWGAVREINPTAFVYSLIHRNPYQRRLKKFEAFIDSNICKTPIKYIQSTLNDAELDYDCVICESDVIWSPGFSGGHFDRSFFLALDSMRDMKRIAYAPSMADGDLTEKQEVELYNLLRYVDFISCRESYEKDILEKYTDKPVTHVLDPVMLLSPVDYEPVIADRLSDKKYILLYLPVNNNNKLRHYAASYAKKYSLDIIEISTKLHEKEVDGYKCIGDAGVEEFLSGIKYSECVFTNSFHAICFSAIFHKEFYAFSRAYSGKVKDICDVLGLKDYYFPDDVFLERKPIDYVSVDEKIAGMRNKSEQWLKTALLEGWVGGG